MRRAFIFMSGLLIGGALLFFAMNFHILRTEDGFHLVPKASAQLPATYADIREYQATDWAEHADIVTALVFANRRDLINGAINRSVDLRLAQWLNRKTP